MLIGETAPTFPLQEAGTGLAGGLTGVTSIVSNFFAIEPLTLLHSFALPLIDPLQLLSIDGRVPSMGGSGMLKPPPPSPARIDFPF